MSPACEKHRQSDLDIKLTYNIDIRNLEARDVTPPVRSELNRLGFKFSWLGGPHWGIPDCTNYESVVSELSGLGYNLKLQLVSGAGWNLVESREADDEWEHVAGESSSY